MRAGTATIAPTVERGACPAVPATGGLIQSAARTSGAPLNVDPRGPVAILAGAAAIEPPGGPGILSGTGEIVAAPRHPIAGLAGVMAPAIASVGTGAEVVNVPGPLPAVRSTGGRLAAAVPTATNIPSAAVAAADTPVASTGPKVIVPAKGGTIPIEARPKQPFPIATGREAKLRAATGAP